MPVDLNFMVGGEAGQGVQSVALLLGKTLARGGYHVFADQDYESRIRGGHNFFRVHFSDSPVSSIEEQIDVLVALNDESIRLHAHEVRAEGAIVYDREKVKEAGQDSRLIGVPLERLAVEKGGNKIMTNTVALGAALALVRYDPTIVDGVLTRFFGAGDTASRNIAAARAGFDFVSTSYSGSLPEVKALPDRRHMLMTGNEALTLGAIAAGCRFMAAYPMTPTTPIMEYFAGQAEKCGLVMVHAEDEISAIIMAIGASFAGVRAMTATSGSGFCLMTEGLGLAGITETPLVIVEGQRAGPAVGLPTRTEQGDLLFVLHAHQGDFPRAVLAPTSIEDCFWSTVKAFNLADRYQTPVFVMTDLFLAGSFGTLAGFDLSKVKIDRGMLWDDRDGDPAGYLRHKVTESGISPRALPGLGKALVVTDCDEHDEAGHLTEDARARAAQVEKRLRKLVSMRQEVTPPLKYGPEVAETLLIGWGSTYGTLRKTVDILSSEMSIGLMQMEQLWPFPADAVSSAMDKAKRVYVVESNASGQLARLIRTETGKTAANILRYDGRPLTPAGVVRKIKEAS